MEINLYYKPTDKQRLFHQSDADEVLFGGAAGGGKSTAIVMDAFFRCMKTPRLHAYLFRRTYRELDDTLVMTARQMIPAALGKYNAERHEFRLINGSSLRFKNCRCEADKYLYQGAEIHCLYIDELTHFTKSIYDYLKTRLRAPKSLHVKPVIRLASNPGGIGHAWVKQRFIGRAAPYEVFTETIYSKTLRKALPHTLQYIPALVTDNPHINEEYAFELEQKPRALREALLKGDWDVFSGQAFPEWQNNPEGYADGLFTHVVAPFPISESWPVSRSFDFGYSRPFSVLWWAADADGRVILVAEWYGAKEADEGIRLHPAEIAKGILGRERELFPGHRITGVADPSIWDSSRGESVALQMEKQGVYFFPAENARLAGKMQLHYRLAFDAEGRPLLYVFSTCREFIRTITALTLDKGNPEDVDTACEDHAYDACRYFLMHVPMVKKACARQKKPFDPLDDGGAAHRKGFLDA